MDWVGLVSNGYLFSWENWNAFFSRRQKSSSPNHSNSKGCHLNILGSSQFVSFAISSQADFPVNPKYDNGPPRQGQKAISVSPLTWPHHPQWIPHSPGLSGIINDDSSSQSPHSNIRWYIVIWKEISLQKTKSQSSKHKGLALGFFCSWWKLLVETKDKKKFERK